MRCKKKVVYLQRIFKANDYELLKRYQPSARDLGIESFTITWYSDDPDETTEYSISGKIKEE